MASKQWIDDNADKMRAYRRKWYANNKEHAKQRVLERRRLLREWFDEYKAKLYCPCGEDHIACLEFHHLDSNEKESSLAAAVHNGWSIERIEREVTKCQVLCANCHRKLHWPDK